MDSGDSTIPYVNPPRKHPKDQNNQFVKHSQEKRISGILFVGRPINSEVHKIMKISRNIYRYQIRKCSRVEDYLRKQTISENKINEDTDLFAEIRKQ